MKWPNGLRTDSPTWNSCEWLRPSAEATRDAVRLRWENDSRTPEMFTHAARAARFTVSMDGCADGSAAAAVVAALSLIARDRTSPLASRGDELEVGARTIRDIFGDPFRPVRFDLQWRTATAVALARQAYSDNEFALLPILADALQDAGCESDDILNHCRDLSVTHVRGCWVVDLVLGKS